MSETVQLEQMEAQDEDGWSEWIHPLPGYLMGCCDCGLVHEMEFEIAKSNGDARGFNRGEGTETVIIFRARRHDRRAR